MNDRRSAHAEATDTSVPGPVDADGTDRDAGRVRMMHRSGTYILACGVLLILIAQVALLLWLIWERTTDAPVGDEWYLVDFSRQFDAGKLTLGDFLAFSSDHRVVLYRIIHVFFVHFLHWNRQLEMTLAVAMVVAIVALLGDCLRRTLGSWFAALLCIVPLSLLLFSLGQYELWVTTFGVGWFSSSLGVTLALWALMTRRPSWWGLILAMSGAMMASLTNAAGLAAWVVFLPVLWLTDYRAVRFIVTWVTVGAATIVLYVHGMPLTRATRVPLSESVRFALAFLGAPLSTTDPHRAQQIALAGIAITVVNLAMYRWLGQDWKGILVWIAFALYPLAFGVLTSIGRGPVLGLPFALTSRYQSFGILWWVSLTAIGFTVLVAIVRKARDSANQRALVLRWGALALNCIALPAMCFALVGIDRTGFRIGEDYPPNAQREQSCILNVAIASDRCLRTFFYYPGVVRERTPYLAAHHLAVFHTETPLDYTQLTKRANLALVSIDKVSTVSSPVPDLSPIVIPQGSAIPVSGWAMDADAKSVADGVLLTVDDRIDTLASYGSDRPDVANYLHQPANRRSGFAASVPTTQLSPGRHTLTLKVIAHDRRSYYASGWHLDFEVKPLGTLTRSTSETLASVVLYGVHDPGTASSTIRVSDSDFFIVSGWALDRTAGTPARGIYLSIDNTLDIPLEYSYDRADVAAVLGPAYLQTGFGTWIVLKQIPPGMHTLTLKVVAADGQSYYVPDWTRTIEKVA